ncbi:hypothetical protein MT356_19875 [Rathayibacter festucae]|uniref:hypothetical protein n=1 Tax=Rathayibacter festucae TaxID=110937 RepID=UPI001FB4221B|nr:hypothetical protein [Rathayibacter festucae]MCJ1701976.1 hypothetical protein [Rathayibacter festucae]
MSMKLWRASVASVSTAIVAALVLLFAPAAQASPHTFTVQWSHIGIFPRSSPQMNDSNRVGAALADGTPVSVVCETTGATVTSDVGTSDIWERLDTGAYLPNVFVETNANGFTPGVPRCDAPAATSAVEEPSVTEGYLFMGNQNVPHMLLQHYYSGTGQNVEVDFDFYAADARLMDWAKQLPEDSYGYPYKATAEDGDVYWATGGISVARTSDNCFSIRDHYDFSPNKVTNWPYIGLWADQYTGAAKEFTVRSLGCA